MTAQLILDFSQLVVAQYFYTYKNAADSLFWSHFVAVTCVVQFNLKE